MDGAITELGYARSAELIAQAEHEAKRLAEQLALDVVAYDRTGASLYVKRLRGLPESCSEWPEHLWDAWCCDVNSSPYSEHEMLTLRAPFIAQAALTLDGLGFDCR